MHMISALQIRALVDWEGVLGALHEAHQGARPFGDSYFVGDSAFGLFSRGVISPGVGSGFKLATLCPANRDAAVPLPTEHGLFLVVDEQTKAIAAALDGGEITRWKTAADSALAASMLSRVDSSTLLAIGAGPISKALVSAFMHVRPSISKVLLWNRSKEKLQQTHDELVADGVEVRIVDDLDEAVACADIITCATSAQEPLVKARFVRPGTHIDLVGGYRPDMQEAESEVFRDALIYVDDLANALASGDLQKPLQEAVIEKGQIRGDLFDLCQGREFCRAPEAVTVYKNAGGAHLDLAVSKYVVERLNLR